MSFGTVDGPSLVQRHPRVPLFCFHARVQASKHRPPPVSRPPSLCLTALRLQLLVRSSISTQASRTSARNFALFSRGVFASSLCLTSRRSARLLHPSTLSSRSSRSRLVCACGCGSSVSCWPANLSCSCTPFAPCTPSWSCWGFP